jgi:hypothetical protein
MQHFSAHRSKVVLVMAVLACAVGIGWAGNPHFVSTSVTCDANSFTVCVKEAGLGDEAQITVLITATAACINPGERHPRAANKEDIADESEQPVQNGRADFCRTVTATFQPECSPPMTVVFTNITVSDEDNDLFRSLGDCP